MIGTNFTYSDNIVKGWPQFAEAAYAYFYYVFEETITAKFIKVFGLLATANLLGTLLRFFSVPRLWILIGVALFLVTPEFSYMATSLKTDNVLKLFEFA